MSAPTESVGTELAAVAVAVYGTVGIALVASLVITTYTRVLQEFSVSDADLVAYMLDNDTFPNRYRKQPELTDFEPRTVRRAARDKVWEEFRQIVEEQRFGDPILGLLWQRLRFSL